MTGPLRLKHPICRTRKVTSFDRCECVGEPEKAVDPEVECHVDEYALTRWIQVFDPRESGEEFLPMVFDVVFKKYVNDEIGEFAALALIDEVANTYGPEAERVLVRMGNDSLVPLELCNDLFVEDRRV